MISKTAQRFGGSLWHELQTQACSSFSKVSLVLEKSIPNVENGILDKYFNFHSQLLHSRLLAKIFVLKIFHGFLLYSSVISMNTEEERKRKEYNRTYFNAPA
jgi:hypothetical protein